MQDILHFLRQQETEGFLPLSAQKTAAEQFNLPISQIERLALTEGILPSRYQRNRETISTEQQLILCKSNVAVIGCGGLGGYIIEELARIGVGGIVAVDPDVFDEHNLNRQLLATTDLLGRKKVEAAVKRVAEINPAVELKPVPILFNEDNAQDILQGINVAVDALDSIPTRLQLAEKCAKNNIPLVHGAIAGWDGRVTTQFPGEKTLQQIYSQTKNETGIETRYGNPSFTPALVASIEVAEVIKILLHTGTPLRNRYLAIDLFHNEFTEIPLLQDDQ